MAAAADALGLGCGNFLPVRSVRQVRCFDAPVNLHIKFSAWNVDFSSPSPDPPYSSRPAHVGVKKGYPCKVVIYPLLACLACKWLQLGTAMLLIITSTDELLTNVNIDDLE